jgi:transposase
MPALKPVRRNIPARVLAERLGVSTRTIYRYIAEPRDEYEARATERRRKILEMREQGMTIRKIAAELGVSVGLVGTYTKQAEHEAAEEAEREAAAQENASR